VAPAPVPADRAHLAAIALSLKERARTLVEMAEQSAIYFTPPESFDPQATAKFWGPEAPQRYAVLIKRIEAQEAFDPESLEGLFRGLVAEMGLKLVDLAQLTRIALTGKAASPPVFQVAALLGKAETLKRLKAGRTSSERALHERGLRGERGERRASSSRATGRPCPMPYAASRARRTCRSRSSGRARL